METECSDWHLIFYSDTFGTVTEGKMAVWMFKVQMNNCASYSMRHLQITGASYCKLQGYLFEL